MPHLIFCNEDEQLFIDTVKHVFTLLVSTEYLISRITV